MTTPTCRAALAELVAVKDIKERAAALHFAGPSGPLGEGWEAEWKRLEREYIERQPKAWAAARSALALEAVPTGFVMVPKEPTPEMLNAAAETPGIRAIDASSVTMQLRGYPIDRKHFESGSALEQAYRAMLAAAPQPQIGNAEIKRAPGLKPGPKGDHPQGD